MNAPQQFRTTNHYVPRVYLKNWTNADGKLWVYRTLVAHENWPAWKTHSTKSIAHREHLYTEVAMGVETDEFERWLADEFEHPAANALRKAVTDEVLTENDWRSLARFAAAQDERTPARLLENLTRWRAEIPAMLDRTVTNALREYQSAPRSPTAATKPPEDDFPVHTTIEPSKEGKGTTIRVEVPIGRKLWLRRMKSVLTESIHYAEELPWTILRPREGFTFFTSDNPVIKLNYVAPDDYDFKGGWGRPKGNILLPLGPGHLLFAQIGLAPPPPGTSLSFDQTAEIRRMIAENAHRYIFAFEQTDDVSTSRRRVVNAEQLKREEENWKNWNTQDLNESPYRSEDRSSQKDRG